MEMWFPYSLPISWKAESQRERINDSLADSRPREFLIGFYLHNPVSREWGVELQLRESRWVKIRVNGKPMSVGYYPNDKDRLSEIICRVLDAAPAPALARSHTHVSNLISQWSAWYGRGIAIGGLRIADLDHDARWRVLPHRPSAEKFSLPDLSIAPPEFWPVANLYREARSATSDRYRLLCCYKILQIWRMGAEPFGDRTKDPTTLADRVVTEEMLVLSGAIGHCRDWEGIGFDALADSLRPWRDQAIEVFTEVSEPPPDDDYERRCELSAVTNLADLAVHAIVRDCLAHWEQMRQVQSRHG